MKRPPAHKINERGMRLFENTVPDNWVCNPQEKDYGKDYLVEIGEDTEEMSGESFYVQLKILTHDFHRPSHIGMEYWMS